MFVLATQYLFWFPVKVSVPDTDTPGKFNEQTFEVQFEAVGADEAKTMDATAASNPEATYTSNQIAWMKRVVRNWRGVVDPAQSEIPFSDTSLELALQISWVRNAINAAYLRAMAGEARTGN